MNNNKIWFGTRCFKRFRSCVEKKLLNDGYRVAATSRSSQSLQDWVQHEDYNLLPLSVNISDETDIKKAFDATIKHFGSLDVLVNNAGHGLIGAVEELSDAEARSNFDVNVFGALNITRQVLPQMRRRQSEYIF